jgi:putative FmdB family regulatory protein
MPTYEYECRSCGHRFEVMQAITQEPLTGCPQCGGIVDRLISGGTGFILKNSVYSSGGRQGSECSLEQTGRTCCGRDERCGKPACGGG